MVKSRSELFDLWCSVGRDPIVKIPQYERPDQQLSQGYRPRTDHYSFQED